MMPLRVENGSHDFDAKISPIIPGFSPDPSICFIDPLFFLVTSSFHLYPGLPIYVSRDLKSWRLLGHGIHRRNQLSLRHSDTELPTTSSATVATGGLWAPTIRHHAGTTYIICTNVVFNRGRTDSTRRNFIIRTADILSNEWSDPVYFDFDGIDPSVFFDDDGKTYVQACAHPRGGIWQFEIDIETAQPLAAPKLLWEGWDRRFTEGPHVYKKDGYYYLVVAEGGTFETHMISVARSRSIHGPFVPCPRNPLLSAGGTNDFIHHTGHGDFFQDAGGKWWTVFLAVQRSGARYPLGRETFLARVEWPEGEWPTIHRPSTSATFPCTFVDNSFVLLRDADLTKYTFSDRGAVISASPGDPSSHKDTFSFAGRRQISLVGSVSVALCTPSLTLGAGTLKAGICLYKDEHRFGELGYDFNTRRVYFRARNKANGYKAEKQVAIVPGNRLYLRICYTELEWMFQYRTSPGEDWVRVDAIDTLRLSGRDFTGPIIADAPLWSDRRKKCDRSRPGLSCKFCIKRGIECVVAADPIAGPSHASIRGYETLTDRDEGRSRPASSLITADASLSEELVELYFRFVHIAFHNLFHRPTFIKRVRDGSIPKILFFGVASLSARYSTHDVFARIRPWDRGRPYRDETKRLLDVEDTSLTSIQACMLLAANASAEGDPKTEAVYHAIAFRMAMLLDLPTIPTESLLEQEINRRVWWSLITTETWTSAAHSLPRLAKPRDTVPLPMDERKFLALGWDVPAPSLDSNLDAMSPSGDTSRSLVAQMVQLNILLYDIVLLNARVVAEQVEEGAGQDMTQNLADALEDWASNLPSQLQYSEENVAYWVREGLGAMFITLHINHNHAGQLLFYHHLHSVQDVSQDALVNNAARSFAQRCKQHATNLCDLIYKARQHPDTVVMYPLAGHILCLASTVQIHTLLFSPYDNEIHSAKTHLERNFELISSMNNYWPMNHMSIGRLQLFHNTCLRSKDDSFRLDAWMLRFLLGFTQQIEDRDAPSSQGQGSARGFDHLRNLLDI